MNWGKSETETLGLSFDTNPNVSVSAMYYAKMLFIM